MVPKRYEAAGKCIYCPNQDNSPLGEEHIIPLCLGGKLILPEASCKKCGRVTSKFENHCADRMFRPARAHLGIKGRAKIRRTELAVLLDENINPKRKKIPLHLHPGMLWMFRYPMPSILLDDLTPRPPSGRLVLRGLHDNLNQRLSGLPSEANLIEKPFESPPFARLLAKIGHAYTTAIFGLNGFEPILKDVILQNNLQNHLLNFVGSDLVDAEKSTEQHAISHQIEESVSGKQYIVVRIHLFAKFDMPRHQVVTGIPI